MPHLHPEGIDFVVSAFVVHKDSILLVHHKKLNGWFPPGGHIEHGGLGFNGKAAETPDQALFRELEEETGLTPDLVSIFEPCSNAIPLPAEQLRMSHRMRQLLRPWRVDSHDFGENHQHQHVALCYLLRSYTNEVRLEVEAHNQLVWWTHEGLMLPATGVLLPSIRAYALAAIDEAGW